MDRDQRGLQVEQWLAVGVEVVPRPLSVGLERPGGGAVVEAEVEQLAPARSTCDGGRDLDEHLDPAVEVAVHQVGRADPGLWLAAVLEPEDAAVLEEAAEDAADADVLRQARDAGRSAQMPRDPDLDRDAGLRGAVERSR